MLGKFHDSWIKNGIPDRIASSGFFFGKYVYMDYTTLNHGGNCTQLALQAGCSENEILDFSANINPLGPPEYVRSVISRTIETLARYPDPDCQSMVNQIAAYHGIPNDTIIIGNGSSEILYAIPQALPVKKAIIPVPSYIDYAKACNRAHLMVTTISLAASEQFQLDCNRIEHHCEGKELVWIGQPNNPTGKIVDNKRLQELIGNHPDTFFVIDESFANFVSSFETMIAPAFHNCIVVRSMTKFYAIPGIRLGYAIAHPTVATKVRNHLLPWSVNTIAQAVGTSVIGDTTFTEISRQKVTNLRGKLYRQLTELPNITIFSGEANFLLLRLDRNDMNASALASRMLQSRIAIRVCENFEGLDKQFFRIAVRNEWENTRFVEALSHILYPKRTIGSGKKKSASAIMFQGTASNAGKSILTAALCRILIQDGIRVAPFKAQNMSLNSFVTRDGGEMGRAQVVQAQACHIDPDVRMNPVLLKPNSDTGSQVIVKGKPIGSMAAGAYVTYKTEAFKMVKECYDSLSSEYDVVVLEGAGSPGEVNLKHHDIVNMAMAKYAHAPVLLVGDIDRGGVFASFIGTMEVLSEWERALVAGFVVNRFRGDATLLAPAFEYVRTYTGKPVFGVIPYLKQLGLPQEDSVAFKSGALDCTRKTADVEIALIDLPHISNFTDFEPFDVETDVHVRIIRQGDGFETADAVIIPGSKNVISDMAYLRSTGIADGIRKYLNTRSGAIIGICGGFQMLGTEIDDPFGIESNSSTIQGLGLLPLRTSLARDKTLSRTSGTHTGTGEKVEGYEIHHGQTAAEALHEIFKNDDGTMLGVGSDDHRIWGTYLHGVFHCDGFRRWFINRLRTAKGLAAFDGVTGRYEIESAFERLAQTVRKGLDMEAIYRLLKL